MKTNRQFYEDIRGSATTFYLADLHVHTPASLDVLQAVRLVDLPPECKTAVEAFGSKSPGVRPTHLTKAGDPPGCW